MNKVNDLRQGLQLGFGEGVMYKVFLDYLIATVGKTVVQQP